VDAPSLYIIPPAATLVTPQNHQTVIESSPQLRWSGWHHWQCSPVVFCRVLH